MLLSISSMYISPLNISITDTSNTNNEAFNFLYKKKAKSQESVFIRFSLSAFAFGLLNFGI